MIVVPGVGLLVSCKERRCEGGGLSCEANMLLSICIFGALSIVEVTTYWSFGCSVIWWLRAFMKGRIRAVIWVVVLSSTVQEWPSLVLLDMFLYHDGTGPNEGKGWKQPLYGTAHYI